VVDYHIFFKFGFLNFSIFQLKPTDVELELGSKYM